MINLQYFSCYRTIASFHFNVFHLSIFPSQFVPAISICIFERNMNIRFGCVWCFLRTLLKSCLIGNTGDFMTMTTIVCCVYFKTTGISSVFISITSIPSNSICGNGEKELEGSYEYFQKWCWTRDEKVLKQQFLKF